MSMLSWDTTLFVGVVAFVLWKKLASKAVFFTVGAVGGAFVWKWVSRTVLFTVLFVVAVGAFMLWTWVSSELQKLEKKREELESLKKLHGALGGFGNACGQVSTGLSQMARGIEKAAGVLMLAVGDLVKVSSDAETVRSSIESTGYKWDDQISGMLGKTFPVLAVEDGSKGQTVALPSPDGGKIFFSTEVLRRDEKAEAKKHIEGEKQRLLKKSTDTMKQVEEMLSKPGLRGKDRENIQASLADIQKKVKMLQEQAPLLGAGICG